MNDPRREAAPHPTHLAARRGGGWPWARATAAGPARASWASWSASTSASRPGSSAPSDSRPRSRPRTSRRPGAFPQYYISPRVPLAPAGWALKVGGLVQRPTVLSLEDLTRLPRTDYRIRHHCVEGWSAVAAWHGVRVSELAKLVGADPRATFVEFRSFDADYFSSWDGPSAFHPQTILAYGMNGQPLRPEHGAPLRLYSGVKLGYKMVKYLTEVNFLPEPTGGYLGGLAATSGTPGCDSAGPLAHQGGQPRRLGLAVREQRPQGVVARRRRRSPRRR